MSTTKSPVRTSSVPLQSTAATCTRDEVDKELWGWFQDFLYEVKKVKRVTKTSSQEAPSSSSFEPRRRQSSRRQSIVNVISTPTSGVNSGVVSRTATESSRHPFSELGDLVQSPSPPFHARRETLPGSDGMTTTASNLPGRRTFGVGSQQSTTTTPTSSQGMPHYAQSPVTNESLASNPGWYSGGSLESKRESSAAAWSGTAFSALVGIDDLASSTGLMIPQRATMGGPVSTPTTIRTDFNPDPSILTSKSNPSYSPLSGARNPSLSTGSSQPLVWKGIEGTPEDPEPDTTDGVVSQPTLSQQPPAPIRSRHSSGATAQSGESSESRTYRVNSQSFSMRVAVQKQSRLSSAIRSMDRTDLENHMEKAVRLLFQLIKERKVHRNSAMNGGGGGGHNAQRRSSGAGCRRQSMPSNVLGGSIFQSAGYQSENTPRRAGGEKRSSEGEQRRSTDTLQSGGKIHRRNNSGSKQASLAASDVFKTSNTDFEDVEDDDNTQSSSSYSDGYEHHNHSEAVTRKRSKKLIREKRRLEPVQNQEQLTQYHAFQDSKRHSDATSIPGNNMIGSPLDITGVAWDVTIRTGEDANEEDPHQFAKFLKTDEKDRKTTDNTASHHHHHHHHHHAHNNNNNAHNDDNFYPPGLVITDSMDIDDLMGSRSLMDMSDFVQHTELEKEMDKEGNRIMNGYVFSGLLGKGAYGKVRLAYERDNPEKKVAIKIINKSLTKSIGLQKRSQQAHALVQKEIAIMKKLRHKNIVTLHAVVDDPDAEKLYLIMEYIGGGHILQEETDAEKLAEGVVYKAIPEPTVVKYLRQLVDGIRYLHKHKIAHRDIKPTNLLLGDEGRLYIADFGVSELGEVANVNELNISYNAVVEDSKRRDVTPPSSPMASVLLKGSPNVSAFLNVGSFGGSGSASSPESTTMVVRGQKGTPMFWPPEMFKATEQEYFVDGESQDLWALGVTTYMMLTGKSPFKSSRFVDLKNEIISETEVEIPDFLSENAQLLLRSMLNKDPSKRLTLLDVRNHEFMGGYDKRTAAARGSFCVAPADAQEEAAAISVASNAIPMMKFFLFRAKPFFRAFIARIREKIRLRNAAKEELSNTTNHSDTMVVESNSLNSTLSNTQAGRHHTFHDSSHNPSEIEASSIGDPQQHDVPSPSNKGFHQPVIRVPETRSGGTTLNCRHSISTTNNMLDVPQETTNPPPPVARPSSQHGGQITPQPPCDKDASIPAPRPSGGGGGILGPSLTSSQQSKDSSSRDFQLMTTAPTPVGTSLTVSSPRVLEGGVAPIRPLQLASLPGSPNAIKPLVTQSHHQQQQQQAGSPVLLSSGSGSPLAAVPKPQTPSSHVSHPIIHHHNEDDAERPTSVYTKTLQSGARPVSGVYSMATLRRQGSGAWWGGHRNTPSTSSERPGLPSASASGQRVIPPLKGFSSVSLRSKAADTKEALSSMTHASSFNSVKEDPPVRSVSLPSIPVNPSMGAHGPHTPRRRTDAMHGARGGSEERTVSKIKSKLLDAISDGSP